MMSLSSSSSGGGNSTALPISSTISPTSNSACTSSVPPEDDDTCRNNPTKWYFDKAGMENTPSRKSGIDAEKELGYRQGAACFIQEMGQKLKVNQLCNNTAIVYMNRFYMFHSFTHFHRNSISIAAIFLAAKVEEQPRKLDHVVRVAHYIQFRNEPMIDPKSEAYVNMCQELVMNENILLQTLGFDLAVDHPHTHIIKCCQLVRGGRNIPSKDLGQVSYLLATNILHLTTMCVQYRPTLVASLAIHVACKWSMWQIPRSKEGKDWWKYVDDQCTYSELEELTQEYLDIYNKAPPRLKLKIASFSSMKGGSGSTGGVSGMPPLPPLDSLGSGIGGMSSSAPLSSSSQPLHLTSSNVNLTANSNNPNNPNKRSGSRSPSPKRQRVTKPGDVLAPMPPHPSKPHHHPSSIPPSSGSSIHPHGMKPPGHGLPPPPSGGVKTHGPPINKPTHPHPQQQKHPGQPHPSIKQEPQHHHSSSSSSSSLQQQHRKPSQPPGPPPHYSRTQPNSNANSTSSGSKVLPSHTSHSNPIVHSSGGSSNSGPLAGVNYHHSVVSSQHHTGASGVAEKSVTSVPPPNTETGHPKVVGHQQQHQHRPLPGHHNSGTQSANISSRSSNSGGGIPPSSSSSSSYPFPNVKSSVPQQSSKDMHSSSRPDQQYRDRLVSSASTTSSTQNSQTSSSSSSSLSSSGNMNHVSMSGISNPLPTYRPKQPPLPLPNLLGLQSNKEYTQESALPNLSSAINNNNIPVKLPVSRSFPPPHHQATIKQEPIKNEPFPSLNNSNNNAPSLINIKQELESQLPPLNQQQQQNIQQNPAGPEPSIVKVKKEKVEGEEKHKKKKKDKHKDKDKDKERHREEKKHKKDKHKDKESGTTAGSSSKKKDKKHSKEKDGGSSSGNKVSVSVIHHFDSNLLTTPSLGEFVNNSSSSSSSTTPRDNLKIRLSIKKPDAHGGSSSNNNNNKKNSNLRS